MTPYKEQIEAVIKTFPQITPSAGLMRGKPLLCGTVSVAQLRKALIAIEEKTRRDERKKILLHITKHNFTAKLLNSRIWIKLDDVLKEITNSNQ